MRRAVLQDRVKATSEPTPPLIYGTMLHEIFQDALLANQWDLPFLSKIIDKIVEKHVEDLYTIKVGLPTAKEHLQSKMMELSYWAKSFVSENPNVSEELPINMLLLTKTRPMQLSKIAMAKRRQWPSQNSWMLRSTYGPLCTA